MTYSELLHSVTFDEILPFIEKYHGHSESVAMYKMHYDMLRHLTPHHDESDNKTATISNAKLDFDWEKPHVEALSLEGDLWESCLAKELVVAPDVDACPAEIAACCLWHTSYLGFTKEQREARFEEWEKSGNGINSQQILLSKARYVIKWFGRDYWDILPTKEELLKVPSVKKRVNEKIKRYKMLRFSNKQFRISDRKARRICINNEYRETHCCC